MKIEINKIRETPNDESMHLRISSPDGNNYNFRVPQTSRDSYEFSYGYEAMRSLHKVLDGFINKGERNQIIRKITQAIDSCKAYGTQESEMLIFAYQNVLRWMAEL